jgi:GNAT superfamily N-acetyltransferase
MTIIRTIKNHEGEVVRQLILSLFGSHIFSDYTEEGVRVIHDYVTNDSLIKADKSDFTLVAEESGTILGTIKIKRNSHVSMLFVNERFQGRGIGRRLLDAATQECRSREIELTCLTTNSSRFALPFFERFGFTRIGKERKVNGVVFTPMKFTIPTCKRAIETTRDDASHL